METLLIGYFLYVVGYTLLFSLAARLFPFKARISSAKVLPIAVLIPAYREDAVIVESVRHALAQDYPEMKVVVIADQLQKNTLIDLHSLAAQDTRLEVLEVQFAQSTKVKALNAALESLSPIFEIVFILDADNLMSEHCLHTVNASYQHGYRSIQLERKARIENTPLALLDGLSEILNNHIYRLGSSSLKISSALSGSGMAFERSLLKQELQQMDSVGGFDRALEVRLLLQGEKSYYINQAYVLDEKVSKTEAFTNQRRRWIASQYEYLAKYAGIGLKALLKGDISMFNSAFLRNVQLPRVLNIGLLSLLMLLSIGFDKYLHWGLNWWLGLWLGLVLALILAVPLSFYNRDFFKALKQLPGTFWIMFRLMFKLKGANETFIHTSHETQAVHHKRKL